MAMKVLIILTAFVSLVCYGRTCPQSREEWSEGIKDMTHRYREYFSHKNFTKFSDLYTDEFRYLPVGEQAITTRSDLQLFLEKTAENWSRFDYEGLDILDIRSDQAIVYYLMKGFDYNGKLAEVAKFVKVIKCVDGKLKLFLVIWTPNNLSDHWV